MNYNYNDLDYVNEELAYIWPGWTAVKKLGRGASGAVYEIHRNVRSNLEKAAMKVLRVPESEAEAERLHFQGISWENTEDYYEKFVDNIHNEIRIMQRFVGNSHIVSYEDYLIHKREDSIGWDIYIRMELLTGLQEYSKTNPLNEKSVIKLGTDILLGLRDCHKSGIIHRDIKPGNIFVNRQGNFKLGDFGVSRTTPESKDVLSFKGTFGYMAPEVYRMVSTDARSDLYSLGMVLYQCLNDNRLPFVPEKITPESVEIARKRRLAGEYIPDPVHGSSKLKSVIRKELAENPEDRYQTAEEMYNALMDVYRSDYEEKRTADNYPGGRPVEVNSKKTAQKKEVSAIDSSNTDETVCLNRESETVSSSGTKERRINPILILPLVLVAAVVLFLVKGRNEGPSSQAETVQNVQEQSDEEAETQESEAAQAQPAEEPAAQESEPELGHLITEVEEPTEEEVEDQPAEEAVEQEAEMGQEEAAETVDQDYPDYAIDWNDDALEAKMRDITGISSGDIMYSDVRDITKLDLNNDAASGKDEKIEDISALGSLINLKSLDLRGNQISDISALSDLTKLEDLKLSSNVIDDISVLDELTNLKSLDFGHTNDNISNISVLSNLTNLEELRLWSKQISDISALENLTNLKSLEIRQSLISDISVLSELQNLKSLSLSSDQIDDISVLRSLPNLESLNMRSNQISDISVLSALTNLKSLELKGSQISDISVLSSLPNLEAVSLSSDQINDISILNSLPNLWDLRLFNVQISDFSILRSHTDLKSLYLYNTPLSDISLLSSLPNLEQLYLNDNQIEDIDVLSSLTNLRCLYLENNQIRDISALRSLEKLEELHIDNNPISDYSPIDNLNLKVLTK